MPHLYDRKFTLSKFVGALGGLIISVKYRINANVEVILNTSKGRGVFER